MNFIQKVNESLDTWHLLKHPFYKAWSEGGICNKTLQTYAKNYYAHVAAFPRYISSIHSKCDQINMRQVLLGNLNEEEQGEKNHPELWIRFAEGLGCERKDILNPKTPNLKETDQLVEGYFALCEDFSTGLGALYAYERQTPEVSRSKIEGLERFYGVKDERSLEFFNVHIKADEWHSQECADLIDQLNEIDKEKALGGAIEGAKLLWSFLDGMYNASSFCLTNRGTPQEV